MCPGFFSDSPFSGDTGLGSLDFIDLRNPGSEGQVCININKFTISR